MSIYIDKRNLSNENCCAKGCDSLRSKDPSLHFHTLPRLNGQMVEVLNDFGVRESWDRRELWIHRLQIKTTKAMSVKVCSKHFVEADYLGPCDPSRRKNLKRNAVPTRNLPIQLPISHEEAKTNNASTAKRVHPSNLCTVKLEEQDQDDVEMLVEKPTETAVLTKPESEEVDPIKIEPEDEDVMFVEPIKQEIVLVDETKEEEPVHELSNAKVMIIDNNAVLVESEKGAYGKDKSCQVNSDSFYESVSTVAQLYTLTGVMNFKMLDKIVECVRESMPKKLSSKYNLSLEDRVMFCLVKSHLKLPIVAIAFFFKISPAAAGIIFKEYHKVTKDCVNKLTCTKS